MSITRMNNINFIPNKGSHVLYVVLSGISGGKDEPLVQHLSEAVKDRGSVLNAQFANDPLYHDDALPEMGAMSFSDCFDRLDKALQLAGGEEAYTNIIFITHSFSSVIATYYLGVHRQASSSAPRYTLVTIDSDPSPKLLAYLDSLDTKAANNKTQNPFHQSVIDYMRKHDSAEILKSLPITTLNISAGEVGADHEFTNEESKRLLAEKILSSVPVEPE